MFSLNFINNGLELLTVALSTIIIHSVYWLNAKSIKRQDIELPHVIEQKQWFVKSDSLGYGTKRIPNGICFINIIKTAVTHPMTGWSKWALVMNNNVIVE